MSGTQFVSRSLPLDGLELPGPGLAHLWFLDLDRLASPISTTGEKLTPRQERTSRRFYLRLLLGAYLGIPGKDVTISRLVRGKPVLDASVHGKVLDFSSAGSNGCCLIGITSQGQIGVDLEAEGRRAHRPMGLVHRYFSPAEKEALDPVPPESIDARFIHTWSCKEAVVKAAGLGIANQLCRFTVEVDPAKRPAVLHMEGDEPGNWQLAVVRPRPGFLGAVAMRHASLRLEGYHLVPAGENTPLSTAP